MTRIDNISDVPGIYHGGHHNHTFKVPLDNVVNKIKSVHSAQETAVGLTKKNACSVPITLRQRNRLHLDPLAQHKFSLSSYLPARHETTGGELHHRTGCNRRYTKDFVIRIKDESLTESVTGLARKYDIPYSTIWNWVKGSAGYYKAGSKFSRFLKTIKDLKGLKEKRELAVIVAERVARANLNGKTEKQICDEVAMEKGIHKLALYSLINHAKGYSAKSSTALLLPTLSSVTKRCQRQPAASSSPGMSNLKMSNPGHSQHRQQAKKLSEVMSVPTTEATIAEKIDQGFAICFNHCEAWLKNK
ncbi:helix-turn-helix domain-containing protein [Erwinia amylovora]|uniref:helix-turn-helix domain-containing protein n=1 Tax=Erwinia amylovora TaxID=552 RepID=UPI0014442715|nr:helix-turn-helix domain-containing protein [Erwinia amylovora]